MIKVCFANNYPIVHFGVNSYFDNHPQILMVANCTKMAMLLAVLEDHKIDVLILDLELDGLSSIYEVKDILKTFSETKIIVYSSLPEQIYAPNLIKAGVSAFVNKNENVEILEDYIIKTSQGEIIINEAVKKSMALIAKRRSKDSPLYKKLSNREIQVLLHLSKGKKISEIAEILKINAITIRSYKLRLLMKLNVTNLIDLVNKAKTLELI